MIATALALFLSTTPAVPDVEMGSWIYRETTDPITDQRRAVAAIIADNGVLAVKCDAPGPNSVYVSFSGRKYFGAGRSTVNRRPVVFRIGDGPSQETQWRYSDDDFVLLTEDVSRFTGPLLTASRATIRAMTYRYEEVTVTFDTAGAADAISKVYVACGDSIY